MNVRSIAWITAALLAGCSQGNEEPDPSGTDGPRVGNLGDAVAPFLDENAPAWPTEPEPAATGDSEPRTPPPLPVPMEFPDDDECEDEEDCEAPDEDCADEEECESDEEDAPDEACWLAWDQCTEGGGEDCWTPLESCLVGLECAEEEEAEAQLCATYVRCDLQAERCYEADGDDNACIGEAAGCLEAAGLAGEAVCLRGFAMCLATGDEERCEVELEQCGGEE